MTETVSTAPALPAAGPESAVQSEPAPTLMPEDALALERLVTEDDMPVDNWFSEKQQRLLTRSLYGVLARPR